MSGLAIVALVVGVGVLVLVALLLGYFLGRLSLVPPPVEEDEL